MLTPFDDEFVRRLEADYRELMSDLTASGVGSILWLEPPLPNPLWMGVTAGPSDPARLAVVDDVVAGLTDEFPALRKLPFDEWHSEAGYDDDRDLRPDGVHWTPEASLAISDDFLGEQVIRAALGMEFS